MRLIISLERMPFTEELEIYLFTGRARALVGARNLHRSSLERIEDLNGRHPLPSASSVLGGIVGMRPSAVVDSRLTTMASSSLTPLGRNRRAVASSLR